MGGVEPEIIHLPRIMPRSQRKVAVDIGANNGLFAYLLTRDFTMVHAFEANPLLANELDRHKPRNMRVWNVAVSSTTGKNATLRVPVVGKQVLNGWASVQTPNVEGVTDWQDHRVITQALDALSFESISLVKIDVEGHEFDVVKGAVKTLKRHMPWLIIEVWKDNRELVQAFLSNLNYRTISLQELVGKPGSPQNLIFIPANSLHSLAFVKHRSS